MDARAPAPLTAGSAGTAVKTGHPQVEALRVTSSIEPFLRALVDCGGSDLHCKVGSPPRVRIDGKLRRLQAADLTAADTAQMVAEVLRADLVETIPELIAEGGYYGMQTFDQHLVQLVQSGAVALADALAASTSPHDLTVELRRLGMVA